MIRAIVNAAAIAVGVAGMVVASLPLSDAWRSTGLAGMGICMIVEVGLAARGLYLSIRERGGTGPTP